MANVIRVLVGLSVLAFLLAVVVALTGPVFANIKAEGFSRASANLALIAIALQLMVGGVSRGALPGSSSHSA